MLIHTDKSFVGSQDLVFLQLKQPLIDAQRSAAWTRHTGYFVHTLGHQLLSLAFCYYNCMLVKRQQT